MLDAGYEYVGKDATKPANKESEGYELFRHELDEHAKEYSNFVVKEAAKVVVKEGVKAVEKELESAWGGLETQKQP